MTRIEAETAGGLGGDQRGGSTWSQILVPIVTAVLVLALGLVLVTITSDSGETRTVPTSPVAAPER
jgi:hypothetical protein